MKDSAVRLAPIRFGVFELNPLSGELRKQGLRVKLSLQVRKLLLVLLEHPGQICTREQLRQRLWPADTFVAFDHSLNKAIHVLREALGDSAVNPRYIETVAGHGYRFIPFVQETLSRHQRGSRKLRHVALLPLDMEPVEPEMQFLNKRILESIIDTLSLATGLRVLAHHMVSHYRSDADPLAAGRELQVEAVVVGEMMRRNDELLLHMELIDVTDGSQIWGAQFKERWSDAFSRPDKIAHKISKRLRPMLTVKLNAPLAKK